MTLLAVVAVIAVAVPHTTMAAGTRSGTAVDNTALVSWDAGAIGYTTSDTASFVVDQYVNIDVSNNGATALTVFPNQVDQVLAYDVINNGNSTIDINISAVGTAATVTSNVRLYEETDGTPGWTIADSNIGALSTTLVSATSDTIRTFYVVSNVQSGVADGAAETYDLVAVAYDGAGSPLSVDNAVSFTSTNAGTVQNIMFDEAGTNGGAANDGEDSAEATYNAVTAALTATKTFTVTDSRPFNANNHPIPGATVTYRIVLVNNGSGDATTVSVSDTVPSGTTFSAGSISESAGTGTYVAPDVLWNISNIAGGTSVNLTFDVTITPTP